MENQSLRPLTSAMPSPLVGSGGCLFVFKSLWIEFYELMFPLISARFQAAQLSVRSTVGVEPEFERLSESFVC